ncbi:hypothetical protein HMPREF0204_12796 [Chryseobacterium gleum ATCC 35910]|uniref:Uncharacterized protein n=1 Tax=Chryseobacterium gleum ATCC 35910 TaxID=525257 RepID=A0ABP2ILC0_CHRGE|nr:hypothetical protein HMPREF0204_12796 [Chryseobacterium gleum ATCC 35910]
MDGRFLHDFRSFFTNIGFVFDKKMYIRRNLSIISRLKTN